VDAAENRIRRIFSEGKLTAVADLTPSAVLAAVNTIRKPGKEGEPGLSLRTASHYIAAIKGFSRWLYRDRRSRSDELASLKGFNAEADRRRIRRDLSPDELFRLLLAAEAAPTVILPWKERDGGGVLRTVRRRFNLPERVWTYRLAAETGFRASEIASLTPESFDLTADEPTITIQAACSKHRRTDVQVIRREFAELLTPWLKNKPRGAPVCRLPEKKEAAVLRADLRSARAAWIREAVSHKERRERRDDPSFLRPVDASDKVVDFHSLRVTFISRVIDAGANLKQAMELARHSDPKLTMRTYARVGFPALARVLDRMNGPEPRPAGDDIMPLRATGTENTAPKHSITPTLFPRQLRRELARNRAPERNETAGILTIGPVRNSHDSAGERDSVRSGAFGCESAEGRTRTADLRVMNPAL